MFVKAELMPYQIKITNVRLERLQDISDEDCLKEGVQATGAGFYVDGLKSQANEKDTEVKITNEGMKLFPSPRAAYAALIDRISGKRTWEQNPHVMAYDFERIV